MNDLDFIDRIYAAVEDPINGWPSVVQLFADRYPEARTMLGTYRDGSVLRGQSATDLEETAVEAYVSHYGSINPVVPPLLKRPPKNYFDADEFVPPEEFIKTEVYNDFWRPLGNLQRNVGVVLENDEGLFSTFCTHYPVDVYDDLKGRSPGATIYRIMPHLRRALRMQTQMEAFSDLAVSLMEQLSSAGQAVFVIGFNGKIQSQNTAAESLLSEGRLFRVSPDNRLHLQDARADELFQARLRLVSCLKDRDILRERGDEVFRTADGHVFKVHIGQAAKGIDTSRRFSILPERRILVQVQRLAPRVGLDDEAVRLTYGLTPAEIRLAASLYAGATLQSYSDATGISVHTARNQLRAIFDKTGTRRQAELTALLSSFT